MTELKVGVLHREVPATEIVVKRAEDGKRIDLSFPASSETPVERWFGTEILSHADGAAILDRAAAGAVPFLFNHNRDDPIGMVDGAQVRGGRLWVDAHLFDTARAIDVGKMIDGGLRNISIGYELDEVVEDKKSNTYTATAWRLLEVSNVTIPADFKRVGIGRAAGEDAKPVRVREMPTLGEQFAALQEPKAKPTPIAAAVRALPSSLPAAPAAIERKTMTVETQAAAGVNADQTQVETRAAAQPRQGPNAMQMEAERKLGIENICKMIGIDDNIREHWIGTGLSIKEISDEALRIQQQRSESQKSVAAIGLSAQETQQFSLFRAIRATANKDWSKAGFELECSREIAKRMNRVSDPNKFFVPFEVQERQVPHAVGTYAVGNHRGMHMGLQKRDLTVGTTTAGGFLVETGNMSFVEMLRNRAVAFRMGARRLSGLVGNVTVPKQTGAATAVWLATEASTITESQQVFAQMALSPKTVGAYTEISRQLLLQSSPDAEGIVTSDLASVTSLAYDLGVVSGSGASGQPTGISNTAGIGSVAGAGFIAAAFARILEFQTDVATANVMPAAGGYVTSHGVASSMIQAVKYASTASPVWEGNVWDGSMQGFPAMGTNQMAAATMLFGDWSQVVVAEWGVLEIEVNPYANFQAGILGVRAIVSMDCGLRYPAAFSLASSIA